MYLRSIYAIGDPAGIDTTLTTLTREAVPAVAGETGYVGFSMFADRELGKILMGSWWADEEAAGKSNVHLEARRLELLSGFAAGISVRTMEVAVVMMPDDVPGPGAWFRLGRLDFAPFEADRVVAGFKNGGLPGLKTIPGLVSCAMVVDREAGHAEVGTIWADHAALVASRGPQAALRMRNLPMSGAVLGSLEEFEVVLLHRL